MLHRPRGIILIESTKINWFSGQNYSCEVIRIEYTKIKRFL
jgi:hypothetical protein